jgi:hypothetical protein
MNSAYKPLLILIITIIMFKSAQCQIFCVECSGCGENPDAVNLSCLNMYCVIEVRFLML